MPPLPKPAHLYVVDKAHAHRANHDAPEGVKDLPVAPSRLSPTAQGIFDRMVLRLDEIGLASASHTETIAIYAESEEEITTLTTYIAYNGRTYTTDKGVIHPYPEVAMLATAKTRCLNILGKFGLNPSDANRVKAQKKTEKKNAFADLDD
jgi:P27 family predicted phage terminase small subunit